MSVPTSHLPEPGDRLSRDDFEAICRAHDIKHAELINGVVRLPAAAVRFREHGEPHSNIWGGSLSTSRCTPKFALATTPPSGWGVRVNRSRMQSC
ncbi:MAG: hypothetical protein KDA89_18285, partial [Planctomycetaceae bacterium]|nr:hypothetical protein [Planctomycetaceae bacterium]